jgi:hypothetical protein
MNERDFARGSIETTITKISLYKRERTWRDPKRCGNARQPIADTSTILTGETERERYQKEQSLRISRMTGSVPCAELGKRCSGLLPDPGLLLEKCDNRRISGGENKPGSNERQSP